MNLPLGFGRLDFSGWFYGLWAGAVQGGAGAITGGIALSTQDPYYAFGNSHSFNIMWKLFAVNALLGIMSYLAKHPAPEKIVESTVKTMETPAGTKITTTVKETSVEPKP